MITRLKSSISDMPSLRRQIPAGIWCENDVGSTRDDVASTLIRRHFAPNARWDMQRVYAKSEIVCIKLIEPKWRHLGSLSFMQATSY